MVHCEHCGWVPVPESHLPVLLPDVDNYIPNEEGESPLADIAEWVNTTCPNVADPQRGRPTPCPTGRVLMVLPAVLRSPQRQGVRLRGRNEVLAAC